MVQENQSSFSESHKKHFSVPSARANAALDVAVSLAVLGPRTGGNPQVGCVILNEAGEIISTGYHRGAGTKHAEVDALSHIPTEYAERLGHGRARGGSLNLAGHTAIVTLVPCAHVGRTPPCAQALVDAGIGAVYWATEDPNPSAQGGREILRSAGIIAASCEEAGYAPEAIARAQKITEEWRTAVSRKRPWVIAKIAQTLDGYVAASDGTSQWITSDEARRHAHSVRATVDAILVGTGTVLVDNPRLTVRTGDMVSTGWQPKRVVVGTRDLPDTARVFPAHHYRTHDIPAVLDDLYNQGDRFVLIEGGPTVVSAALRAGVVDELHVYTAPLLLGEGRRSIDAIGVSTLSEALSMTRVSSAEVGSDIYVRYRMNERKIPAMQDNQKT